MRWSELGGTIDNTISETTNYSANIPGVASVSPNVEISLNSANIPKMQ
jgi:hypothetical protein